MHKPYYKKPLIRKTIAEKSIKTFTDKAKGGNVVSAFRYKIQQGKSRPKGRYLGKYVSKEKMLATHIFDARKGIYRKLGKPVLVDARIFSRIKVKRE